MIRSTYTALLFAVTGLIAGCGTTSPSRFYVLTPVADAAAAPAGSDLSVSLDPVAMPSLLDRPQIVTTLSDHERSLAEFARWAEPLDDNVTSVVAENLATLLGTERVTILSERKPDVRVSVRLVRFDAALGEASTLTAQWRIAGPDGTTLAARRGTYSAPLDSDDYEAVAAAMSGTLADLCRDLATAVRAAAGNSGS